MADDERRMAASCQHCHTPVIRDPHGQWIHTSLRYPCIDRWGTLLSTYAEPVPAREVVAVAYPARQPGRTTACAVGTYAGTPGTSGAARCPAGRVPTRETPASGNAELPPPVVEAGRSSHDQGYEQGERA